MPFKYQAPSDYKSSCLVISGERYEVKNGTVQSEYDIYHFLKPMGFERQVEDAAPATSKKAATASTT